MTSKIVVLVLAALLTAGSCEHGSTHPSAPQIPRPDQGGPAPVPGTPNPRAGDPKPHQERVVIVTANVEDEYAPYTVTVNTTNGVHSTDLVASGPFAKSFSYNSGEAVHVTVEVKPSRAGSPRGFCIIDDGGNLVQSVIDRAWRAQCQLTTNR